MGNIIVDALGEFDVLRTATRGEPRVSTLGIAEINKYLVSARGHDLPAAFQPELVTKSGKFAKRVEAYMRAMYNISLSPKEKETIGNLTEIHASKGDSIKYDLTHLGIDDWPRGSFGNARSCYRGSYRSSMYMIQAGAGYGPGFAIRLFHPGGTWHGGFRGYGRCWVIPVSEIGIALFNGYGQRTSWFAGLIVEALKGKLEVYSNRVRLGGGEGLYVNDKTAWLINTKKDMPSKLSPALRSYAEYVCYGCEKHFWGTEGDVFRTNEGTICKDCARRDAINGKFYYVNSMIRVEPGTVVPGYGALEYDNNGEFWVKDLYEDLLLLCEECGAAFSRETTCRCDDNRPR